MAVSFYPGPGHGPQPAGGPRELLFAVSGVYLVLGIVMIRAGSGVLRLAPSARRTAIWATGCHLFVVIVIDCIVLTDAVLHMRHIAHTLADEGFWASIVCPTITSVVLALSIIWLLTLKGSRGVFSIPHPLPQDDFRACW